MLLIHLVMCWLNCYGVPLYLWNSDTFFGIGRIWGDSIIMDDATLKGLLFFSGKVQIFTKIFRAINAEINLEVDGRLYPIHVMEEQVESNNMMWSGCVCKCKERDNPKSKNSMQGKNEDH